MKRIIFNPLSGKFDFIDVDDDALQSGDNISELVNDVGYLESGDNVSTLANDAGYITYYPLVVNTKANLLASSPASITVGLASDTEELFFFDGINWHIHPIKLAVELSNPDAGYTQDSDKRGYGDDYIYGKRLYAASLGDYTDEPVAGAIKVTHTTNPPLYQIYLRGRWNTLFYDLTMERGDFEHVPANYPIDVRSGNSNMTGLNGQPIIREYKVDAGAYPRPVIVDGGNLND